MIRAIFFALTLMFCMQSAFATTVATETPQALAADKRLEYWVDLWMDSGLVWPTIVSLIVTNFALTACEKLASEGKIQDARVHRSIAGGAFLTTLSLNAYYLWRYQGALSLPAEIQLQPKIKRQTT